MKEQSTAILLRVFIGESDKHNGQSLYEYFVHYLKKHGFSGVTVLRGIEGFGHSSKIHTANILELSTDLPIVLEIVDSQEKIEGFKKMLEELDLQGIVGLLITEETIKVIKYGKA